MENTAADTSGGAELLLGLVRIIAEVLYAQNLSSQNQLPIYFLECTKFSETGVDPCGARTRRAWRQMQIIVVAIAAAVILRGGVLSSSQICH